MTDTNNVTTLNFDDIKALVDDRANTAKKALADLNDATEGLLAIACLTRDEDGTPDFGEDREVITRLIKAARDFKQAREATTTRAA